MAGDGPQSVVKALTQVASVKRLVRPRVDPRQIAPGINVGVGMVLSNPLGFPPYRNPWYTAIWARHVERREDQSGVEASAGLVKSGEFLPDAIAADDGCLLPALTQRNSEGDITSSTLRPFICESTELLGAHLEKGALGVAAVHLLWAIECITLGEIPWGSMLTEHLRMGQISYGPVPIRGEEEVEGLSLPDSSSH